MCITAGLRRKPDESRLDLINRNVDLFVSILDQIAQVGLKDGAIVHVVSNPVDILTYLAASRLGLPPAKVIGLEHTTRYDSLSQSDCSRSEAAADPVIGTDTGRAWGQHGADLVERHRGRIATG